jgi:hypothetical protein
MTMVTCGNGKLDSGESCEGSNLNGSSCSALGFTGGTLACAASCLFDTTGCTGPLTVAVTPSRTSCTAPCAVFFDATGTTGLMNGDFVNANFNWDFDSTSVNPTGAHRRTVGFVVGHVFDVPGTYQVSVLGRDMAGRAGSTTIPITVSAMTGSTYYVASNGKDTNAGTSMTQPLATVATALGHAAAQNTILLRRGDTFTTSGTSLNVKGPFLIGAYTDPSASSTNAPVLSTTANVIVNLSNTQDVRLTDLHLVSTGGKTITAINFDGAVNSLAERIEIEGVGYKDAGGTEGVVLQVYKGPAKDTFIVDCNIHDFTGYAVYGDTLNQLAVIGTTMARFGGSEHGIRLQGGASEYLAENTLVANDADTPLSSFTFRGNNQKIVAVGNHLNRHMEFTPTDQTTVEMVIHGLAEANLIADNRTTGYYNVALGITAQHIVARNNIFINAPVAVGVDGQSVLPINFLDQIFLYNNTSYFAPPTPISYGATFASHTRTTGSLVVVNNLFAHNQTDSVAPALIIPDKMGTEQEDHNLGYGPNTTAKWKAASGTGDIVGNPGFTSTDPSAANAFQISSGGAAIDTGTMAPVYQDFAGNPRPSGSGWDIGAFELTQP